MIGLKFCGGEMIAGSEMLKGFRNSVGKDFYRNPKISFVLEVDKIIKSIFYGKKLF